MKHHEFRIGLVFLTATGLWKCTDVGTRVIVAIKLEKHSKHPDYNGPPYSVVERVFDEYDFDGCWIPKEGPRGSREKSDGDGPHRI